MSAEAWPATEAELEGAKADLVEVVTQLAKTRRAVRDYMAAVAQADSFVQDAESALLEVLDEA